MRPKRQSDAGKISGEAGATKRRRREGRGWGPFTGGQLTIVIVAIAAMFAIPTAALAAGGAFSNNSATVPAVKATNANAHGIGVQGTGKKFGVLSNGPLGVAAGKSLSCTGCVGSGALGASAKVIQPLASGQSESGVFAAEDLYSGGGDGLEVGITFIRPVPGTLTVQEGPTANCSGPGSAATGYLCIYDSGAFGFPYIEFDATFTTAPRIGTPNIGATIVWSENGGGDAFVRGSYTVKAP